MELAALHGMDDAVEIHFAVDSAHEALGIIPVIALPSNQGFEGDAVDGAERGVEAEEGIVESEEAVLIGAKNHARTELLIEITGGNGQPFGAVGDKVVCQPLPLFPFVVESEERVLIHLEAYAGAESTIGIKDVGSSVETQFLGDIVCPDDVVGVAHLAVDLHVASHVTAQYALR